MNFKNKGGDASHPTGNVMSRIVIKKGTFEKKYFWFESLAKVSLWSKQSGGGSRGQAILRGQASSAPQGWL